MDVPMIAFEYSGRQLAPLLERLLTHHDAELARLDLELERYTPSQRAAAVGPSLQARFKYDNKGNMVPVIDPMAGEIGAINAQRAEAMIAHRETLLWLIECHRTPSARWLLTLRDVGRLYPEQTALEIRATFPARPSWPSRLARRFAAALAGLLAPLRRRRLGGTQAT